jgi:two-component system, LytTR family, response regulator AlgR
MARTAEAIFLALLGADVCTGMREDRAMSLGQAAPDPLRIVVADDDPLFARMVRAHCSTRSGVAVVGIATNDREAVQLNEELAPDIVLLDAGMPDAARDIRDRQDPPSIVLLADDGSDARAYTTKAAAYVRKPADFLELMDVVLALSQLAFA